MLSRGRPTPSQTAHLRRLGALFAAVLFASPLASPGAARASDPAAPSSERVPGEDALLGRLMAPCCWTQTLDIHSGSTPDALRAEIRGRLLRGEPPRAIEDDLVARYGPRIRAEPEHSPLRWISVALAVTALAAALGLALLLRRWTRRPIPIPSQQGAAREPRDAWDDKLDDELRAMD